MHFSELSGQEYTVPGMFIANLLDEPSAAMPVAPMSARSQVIGAMTVAGRDGGAGRSPHRLLRQPRPGQLRGAGACRHPPPGSDFSRRDRSDFVADEGQGSGRAGDLRRGRGSGECDLQRHRCEGARLSGHARQAAGQDARLRLMGGVRSAGATDA